MKIREILSDDISRRNLLKGVVSSIGLGAAGAQASDPKKTVKSTPPPEHWTMIAYPKSYYVPLSEKIEGWRANEKTGEGVESIPAPFYKPWIERGLTAYVIGKKAGVVKPISAQEFLALLLTEGRSDFGFNEEVDLFGKWGQMKQNLLAIVKDKGLQISPSWIDFVVMLSAKQELALKTGIPFYQAWQGSTRFLNRYDLNLKAAQHPKNAAILAFIKNIINK